HSFDNLNTSSNLKNKPRIMATIVDSPIPVNSTEPILTVAPLTPITNTPQDKITYCDRLDSTGASTNIRIPLAATIPNNSKEIPPRTGEGMDEMSAANFPNKDKMIAMPAAIPIIHVEYTLVIASIPMFSPYVVFVVEPTKLKILVEIPFSNKERSRPGSFVKSLFTILLVTNKWPICSGIITSAASKIIKMDDQSIFIW